MTERYNESQDKFLEKIWHGDIETHKAHSRAIENFRSAIDAKGRREFYVLRKRWATFLGTVNVLVIVCIFSILFLTGLGCMKFSDYILGGLITVGLLDNALTRHVTKYLFSDAPSSKKANENDQ